MEIWYSNLWEQNRTLLIRVVIRVTPATTCTYPSFPPCGLVPNLTPILCLRCRRKTQNLIRVQGVIWNAQFEVIYVSNHVKVWWGSFSDHSWSHHSGECIGVLLCSWMLLGFESLIVINYQLRSVEPVNTHLCASTLALSLLHINVSDAVLGWPATSEALPHEILFLSPNFLRALTMRTTEVVATNRSGIRAKWPSVTMVRTDSRY